MYDERWYDYLNFDSFLQDITNKYGKKGSVPVNVARKFFYNSSKKDYDSCSSYWDELRNYFRNTIIFIKLNNPYETSASILANLFSRYYGNETKWLDYLISLDFLPAVKKSYMSQRHKTKNSNVSSIIEFFHVAFEISEYWPLFLSGDEYKYYVIYKAIYNYIYSNNYYIDQKQFSNLYDYEILCKIEQDTKIFNEETGYGKKIYEYCKKRKRLNERLKIYQEKEFSENYNLNHKKCWFIISRIGELTKRYFSELNLYNGNRII